MFDLLWLIPFLPLLAFVALGMFGRRLPRSAVSFVGVLPVGLAFILALIIAWPYLSGRTSDAHVQVLWTWIRMGGFEPQISLYLDSLSVVMMLVVSGVAGLILLYSAEYMRDDDDYSRFFAYMNLFVAAMLLLVLGENLLVLYLGWEGVGLCSYLLIGFWYRNPENGAAARKAFIVTRVGDAAMALGLFLLLSELGTLSIPVLLDRAAEQWPVGAAPAIAAAALLLAGAVGKSAQLPLQTWLPDAMAGPTPVSALIHAATMVTAGVYLIARLHSLFMLAPAVLSLVAIIGVSTLLIAGCSALVQRDIKRVLAYSTISQIGYMFLAMGVGAWSAAIFHFMTHAFFKALLFLGAGVVIQALDDEHDLLAMGGLRKRLPVTFWTFLIAGASLAGFPLVTAGFYSKDLILFDSFASPRGSVWLWVGGVLGVLLTSAYIFRVIFLAFLGRPQGEIHRRPRRRIQVPLIVLAVLSVIGGLAGIPPALGGSHTLSRFLAGTFGAAGPEAGSTFLELTLQAVSAVAVLLGILVSYAWFARRPRTASQAALPIVPPAVQRLWYAGWGFDWLYERVFVQPFVFVARLNRADFLDQPFREIARVLVLGWRGVRLTQTGRVRWYATGVVMGTVVLVAIVVFQ
jgi:NADH-quinone oxidoreductase subunit L